MSLISAKNVSLTYGAQQVLRDVDFEINAGEIVTVIGPNGSGKSTLMRALLGAKPVQTGEIIRKKGLRIGYVPQRLAIETAMPLTVARFLSLPIKHSAAAVKSILERVGAQGLETRQLASVSGGQFQRVVLARALLGDPEILILDEPTQGLDQPGIAGFYGLIEDIRRDIGCAVLMVSHDLHVVMSASDRVICLNGHICCEGTPTVVSAAPEYHALFGHGTHGTMALYQHEHGDHCDHTGHETGHQTGHDHG